MPITSSERPTPNMDWGEIWAEQLRFDSKLRSKSPLDEDRIRLTKDFILHLHHQTSQLLGALGTWRSHRRDGRTPDREAMRLQMADVFKNLIMVAQVWDITPEEFVESFWAKSMIVEQRYSEEFVHTLNRDSVVVDIDNVLADYVRGFLMWLRANEPQHYLQCPVERIQHYERYHVRLMASDFGFDHKHWEEVKHQFREEGGKVHLPVMPGALDFLVWCRDMNWQIILLTSRPIDRYARMYGDTLHWLRNNQLPFDHIWWALDKDYSIHRHGIEYRHILFAVDDDLRFVEQFASMGVMCYHLNHAQQFRWTEIDEHRIAVESLEELRRHWQWQTSKTQVTDHTQPTQGKSRTTPSSTDPNRSA